MAPFTDAELARINAAINEKAGGLKACPVCATNEWHIGPGRTEFALIPRDPARAQEGVSASGLLIVCVKCGYMFAMNVFVLGLGDLFGVKSISQAKAEEAKAAGAAASAPTAETRIPG